METTIIFSHTETGHILEYFHHIYSICEEMPERQFVFVVPERFAELKKEATWSDASNVLFDYIYSTDYKSYQGKSVFKLSYSLSKILCDRIKKYKATKVLSLFWFPIVPFGLLLFPRGLKASAILYDVYLRERDELSLQSRLRHYLNFWLFAKSRKVVRAFVLNDEHMAGVLNEKFNTKHFYALPDPFNPITEAGLINLRDEYGIGKNVTVFAHFGGLDRRKGTLKILDAISHLTEGERKNSCFIFAGRVYSDIKDEFYRKENELAGKVKIIVKDEFCSYGYLASLCNCCDAILMPYENANRSSGILGYASQFGKPVVAPDNGLIGNLVEKYRLGVAGDLKDAIVLAETMKKIMNNEYVNPSQEYCTVNSVKAFCDVIRLSV